jgi:hypothetical protein
MSATKITKTRAALGAAALVLAGCGSSPVAYRPPTPAHVEAALSARHCQVAYPPPQLGKDPEPQLGTYRSVFCRTWADSNAGKAEGSIAEVDIYTFRTQACEVDWATIGADPADFPYIHGPGWVVQVSSQEQAADVQRILGGSMRVPPRQEQGKCWGYVRAG